MLGHPKTGSGCVQPKLQAKAAKPSYKSKKVQESTDDDTDSEDEDDDKSDDYEFGDGFLKPTKEGTKVSISLISLKLGGLAY